MNNERLEQMEKELCVKQVEAAKASGAQFEEAFQLLTLAKKGLSLQYDVNRFAPNVETASMDDCNSASNFNKNNDFRIVPRAVLEHCLEVFININKYYCEFDEKIQTDMNVTIKKLKSALAIEKSELHATVEANNLIMDAVKTLKRYPTNWKINTVTVPGDIFSNFLDMVEKNSKQKA